MTSCTCCEKQWMDRKNTLYKNLGSTSKPFVYEIELLSKFGLQRIKLLFCNLHANNLRDCTRYTNKGVLQILKKSTGRWYNAVNVGKIVAR